ncbi:APC family permease [Actinoplanes teichomyceticus]|uniref:Amino acid/polyamine/organocation transporter (APC superfamily) n=1 Tax=Actinoplanes teichomyceticus TaxID=1867 RepID=A0A561VMS6_ACTTI|nr:APC family permease [Actinoplanes teichomyceticus]TWG12900.1 amino acid/polyamine/organocation transporter (APC superfamily) [Actinoplanes teichomyceticus]GIF13652.1 amino acid transporter [Actinoplanes teichomyceticus]
MSLNRFGYQQQLRRELRIRDLTAYGLVFMVVIAPFGIFGSVFQASGGMIALAYVVGAAAMIVTASSYGVMVGKYPVAGSVYGYAGRAVSPAVGFLTGWAVLLDYVCIPLLLSLVAGASMTSIVPSVPVWAWVIIFVVANTGMNVFGIKTTKLLNWIFLAAELVVLLIFLGYGLTALAQGKGHGFDLDPFYNGTSFTWSLVLGGVSIGMLSYLGFDALGLLAEDAADGARTVRRAMYLSLLVVAALFVAQTWVAALLVPDPDALIADGDPAGSAFYDAAEVAGGPWLATLTALATALAWGVANNMVAQVATSRLLMAMSRDRQLPAFLSRVSPARSVPTNAVLTTAAISLGVGVWMASREDGITLMSAMVNFGAMIAFIVLHLCVIWDWARTGRTGGVGRNVVVPVLGVAILLAVIWHANLLAQRVGLIWLGLGVLVLILLTATGRGPALPEAPAPAGDTTTSRKAVTENV